MMRRIISKITTFFWGIILVINNRVQALDPVYGIDYREPVVKEPTIMQKFFSFSWILIPICWLVGFVVYCKKQRREIKAKIAFINIILCIILTYLIYCIVN